ncbi:VWA domain-containing protein [Deinococcus sp. HMF7620]|uniref:VWA domain-containing protein n=1 Tax=Deinococcus arboris TaxID=2682977 RepID=A0A7C9I0Y8_9DEIO|nr:VWA domain-containing protein [Deinococcus arboris]MVN88508.1 VWA domain-containing protein [Deinococcus arboris]
MTTPRIELRPLRSGLVVNQAIHLPLLIRLHPAPVAPQVATRPPLNLAFVIDRSGSMSGMPLDMARQAALAAVRQLRPADRVSVVAFDDQVDVVVPSQPVVNREAIIQAIRAIEDRGSTNLHGGWLEGATQVAQYLTSGALNRVILLSDGQANVGLTDRDDVAAQVRGLTERGISTSAIGLGAHYDEELLLAVATAGDGNFEHVEDPSRLPTLFEEELLGLTRTTGRLVSLGLEPNPAHGVTVMGLLNAFDQNAYGRFQVPNLVGGQAIDVVVTLNIPAQAQVGQALGVTRVRLAWTGQDSQRHTLRTQLNLPVVSAEEDRTLSDDPVVLEVQALLTAARLKREAVDALDRGDQASARRRVDEAYQAVMAAPMAPGVRLQEVEDFGALSAAMDAGDGALSRKRAVSQAHARTHSKRRE